MRMTDLELAFRLAEIRKYKKRAVGRNAYSQLADSLRINLMLDLYDLGFSVENIWKLLNRT